MIGSTVESPQFSPRAERVLELALREALQLGHNYIGTEHMLLGIVRESEGTAAQVLVALGADLPRVRQAVIELIHCVQGIEAGSALDAPGESAGTTITIRLVGAGTLPAGYGAAHEALREEARRHLRDPDSALAAPLDVRSVVVEGGPGISLTVTYRPGDSPDSEETTGT